MNRRAAGLSSHGAAPDAPAPQAKDRPAAGAELARALELSREIAHLADQGDVRQAVTLDAERRRLLASIRATRGAPDALTAAERALLKEIGELNDRSIGRLEHRLRAKCRDLDMLAVGRRAVRAYGHHRP